MPPVIRRVRRRLTASAGVASLALKKKGRHGSNEPAHRLNNRGLPCGTWACWYSNWQLSTESAPCLLLRGEAIPKSVRRVFAEPEPQGAVPEQLRGPAIHGLSSRHAPLTRQDVRICAVGGDSRPLIVASPPKRLFSLPNSGYLQCLSPMGNRALARMDTPSRQHRATRRQAGSRPHREFAYL